LSNGVRAICVLAVPIVSFIALNISIRRNWSLVPDVPIIGLALEWIVKGVMFATFFPLLIFTTMRAGARPWRHWWSALLGGVAATAIAAGATWLVIVLTLILAERK
jgi:hypothetical protein